MGTEKDRRNSGRRFADLTIDPKVAREECIDPVEYWDDWDDRRDGMRDWASDKSRFGVVKPWMRSTGWRPTNTRQTVPMDVAVQENNGKLARLERVRRARREMKERK